VLFGVKTYAGLVRMLERYVGESSMEVIDDAENNLISDEPEALMPREIRLMKGSHKQGFSTGFNRN